MARIGISDEGWAIVVDLEEEAADKAKGVNPSTKDPGVFEANARIDDRDKAKGVNPTTKDPSVFTAKARIDDREPPVSALPLKKRKGCLNWEKVKNDHHHR